MTDINYSEFQPDSPRLIEEKISDNGDIFWKQRGYYAGSFIEIEFRTTDDDLAKIIETGDFESIDWSARIISSKDLI